MGHTPEVPDAVAPAIRLLTDADAAITTGDPARLAFAITGANQAIALLEPSPNSPAFQHLRASAWMIRGNALRDQATDRRAALHSYDAALAVLENRATSGDTDDHLRDTLANIWTNRGITLLHENTPASLAEAVRNFDAAIALRRTLPLAENPWFRYGLAAGWMNRADALTRLGTPANLESAVQSHNEALAQLRHLPVGENPLFRQRLAIAWLNRGLTLQTRATASSLARALHSFDESIALFNQPANTGPQLILAGAWMNRGNILLRLATPVPDEARAAARTALALVAASEPENPVAAEIGFKSRHVLCQAIAQLLPTAASADDFIAEATDIVDSGMVLARQWELRRVEQFRPLACDLFRFGARVFQLHQPHFLVEFLIENLDPAQSPGTPAGLKEMHTAAAEALWHALRDLQRQGFKTLHTPHFEQLLTQLRDLRIAESRLAELRRQGGV